MRSELTAERLRELLSYEPDTGVFSRRLDITKSHVSAPGSVAGGRSKEHVTISVMNVRYMAHRLAWLYVTGEWPKGVVDHVNGDGYDNRWSNLRDVDALINAQNRHRPHGMASTKVLGVCTAPNGRYRSYIRAGGKQVYVGHFDTVEEARAAYLEAKRRLHDGCTQ
jgi:hypothetical protein